MSKGECWHKESKRNGLAQDGTNGTVIHKENLQCKAVGTVHSLINRHSKQSPVNRLKIDHGRRPRVLLCAVVIIIAFKRKHITRSSVSETCIDKRDTLDCATKCV